MSDSSEEKPKAELVILHGETLRDYFSRLCVTDVRGFTERDSDFWDCSLNGSAVRPLTPHFPLMIDCSTHFLFMCAALSL